jgi:hypothetical protein
MKIKITKELDKQLHDLARYHVKNNICKACAKEYYCIRDASPCEEYDKFIQTFEKMKKPIIQGSTELEKYLYILIEFIETSSKIYDLEKKLSDIQKRKDLIEDTFEYCD